MNKKLHIEIVKAKKSFPNPDAKDLVWRYISSNIRGFKLDDVVRGQDVLEFSGHIHSYTVCSSSSMVQWPVNVEDVIFHVYTMQQSEQNVLNVRERWNKWDPIENYISNVIHPFPFRSPTLTLRVSPPPTTGCFPTPSSMDCGRV